VPVTLNYFSVFENNAAQLGRIGRSDLKAQIIEVYQRAKSMIDSQRTNNDLYQELKHWAVQDKQNPTAFSQEQIDRVRGKMGVYAQSLRRASDLWVKETQSALKSIESYCAEIQSSSNAGAALPRKATRS